MKKSMLNVLLAAMAVLSISGAANALTITNNSFETGDLTGWTANDSNYASVVTSATALSMNTYTAPYGKYFAQLVSGQGTGVYTTLSQTIGLAANEYIEGSAAFLGGDYLPYDDDAYVSIAGPGVLWKQSITSVGDYGDSGWNTWGWTAPSAGNYTLTYAVADQVDSALPSAALFDGPVPEPSSMILGLMSLAGVLKLRKRNKQA